MKLMDLALLYSIAGAACAVALYRRSPHNDSRALLAALTAIPLWPIWAPIAWTARRSVAACVEGAGDRVERIRMALENAVESVRGTPLENLLSRETAKIILQEVDRVSARNRELQELLSRQEFDLRAAEHRLETVERTGASARVLASARVHFENVRRLHGLAERDARGLDELAALVDALRTELMVVKLSGSSAAGVDGIVGDLWANIEGLRQVSGELSTSAAAGSSLS